MFFKIGVLKYVANFTGKHLCWSLILVKLKSWSPAILLKRGFIEKKFVTFLRTTFFTEIFRRLLLRSVRLLFARKPLQLHRSQTPTWKHTCILSRLSWHKLYILAAKCYKEEAVQQICKFYSQITIENKLHFLLNCSIYDEIRKDI